MTHDELLKVIIHGQTMNYEWRNALRAVVKLHKPEHSIRGYRCQFDDEVFPCTHHQAIEKELG